MGLVFSGLTVVVWFWGFVLFLLLVLAWEFCSLNERFCHILLVFALVLLFSFAWEFLMARKSDSECFRPAL